MDMPVDLTSDDLNRCYHRDQGEERIDAITFSSDEMDNDAYNPLLQEWQDKGAQDPPPDETPFAIKRARPNYMSLCSETLRDAAENGFSAIDDAEIQDVRSSDFIKELETDSDSTKPIDAMGDSLAGTLLHEVSYMQYTLSLMKTMGADSYIPFQLTHTNLGGKSHDISSQGICKGWDCVGRIRNPHNAESVAFLGIGLSLFTKGYYVEDDGKVQKIIR